MKTVKITIRGIAPYSQSKKYTEKVSPSLAGKYDEDHWRDHMHVNDDGLVVIPGTGVKQSVEAAAALAGDKVEGRGNKGWTSLLTSGIMVTDDFVTDAVAKKVPGQTFSCDAKGQRGDRSSTRVDRTFPMIPVGWTATGEIHIINDEIPIDRLMKYVELAGKCIGVGRFRPSKGGHNGRFIVEKVEVFDV